MKKQIFLNLLLMLIFFPREGKSELTGIASWYSESDPGINPTTANGEIFDDSKRTCASWNFPFGTYLRVTHMISKRSVTCRVNDRGPSKRLDRIIDLTKSTFQEIAPLRVGLVPVKIEVVRSNGIKEVRVV